jgi:DNA-binding CsgD family transcriptional regulator
MSTAVATSNYMTPVVFDHRANASERSPRRRRPRSAARFGWASLTAAELAVADRVANGRTNREVAAELFVSRHTVDSHLRHIYVKLGIASRVQLTRHVMLNDRIGG